MINVLHRAVLAPGELPDANVHAAPRVTFSLARAFFALCVAIMLIGAVIRFVGLDTKLYENDEATTSLHVSGLTVAALGQSFDGRPLPISGLLADQRPNPARGLRAVVDSLAVEDPQHPPLFYILQYGWESVFGSSVAAHRSLAALFGALAILGAFWFGTELSGRAAGAASGALVAASPFAVVYSQNAREYSLWLLLTFVSSALLLRAMRERRPFWWIAYALASIAGSYTDLLYVIVVVAHAVAFPVALASVPTALRRRDALIGFCAALAIAMLAAAPWLHAAYVSYRHGGITNNGYLGAKLPLSIFALKWIFNIGSLFNDLAFLRPAAIVLALPGIVALIWAVADCVRRVRLDRRIAVALALGAVFGGALAGLDLIGGQSRSTAARYMVPLWASCYALLGVALARAVASQRAIVRALGPLVVGVVALLGFVAFGVSLSHETWWFNGSSRSEGPIARALAADPHPVILWHSPWHSQPGNPKDRWDFMPVQIADRLGQEAGDGGRTALFVLSAADAAFGVPSVPGDLFGLDLSDSDLVSLRRHGFRLTQIPVDVELPTAHSLSAQRQATAGAGISPQIVPSLYRIEAPAQATRARSHRPAASGRSANRRGSTPSTSRHRRRRR